MIGTLVCIRERLYAARWTSLRHSPLDKLAVVDIRCS